MTRFILIRFILLYNNNYSKEKQNYLIIRIQLLAWLNLVQ